MKVFQKTTILGQIELFFVLKMILYFMVDCGYLTSMNFWGKVGNWYATTITVYSLRSMGVT